MYLIRLILVIFVLVTSSHACGVLTHNIMSNRAIANLGLNAFRPIALGFPGALQAGTIFPDWGYNLGPDELHHAAEEAHWPPFTAEFVKLINEKYARPWNDTSKAVISFLLGQVSHSVADILWHDLSVVGESSGNGFIRAQAWIYYDMNYAPSHSQADIGGDFATATQTDSSYLKDEWFLPIDDILEVYSRMNISGPTKDNIEFAMSLTFAASHLLPFVGPYLDNFINMNSPFTQEELLRYFIGGIDDSAAWIASCWEGLYRWVEDGPVPELCYVEPRLDDHTKKRKVSRGIMPHLMKDPGLKQLILDVQSTVITEYNKDKRGSFLKLSQSKEWIQSQVLKIVDQSEVIKRARVSLTDRAQKYKPTVQCISPTAAPHHLAIYSDRHYSQLGESFAHADFDGDGIFDIAVGAPGFAPAQGLDQAGAVFILPGRDIKGQQSITLGMLTPGVKILIGQSRYSRFGTAMAVCDLNKDGFPDLAISAPKHNNHQLQYSGMVQLYFGSVTGLDTTKSVKIELSSQQSMDSKSSLIGSSLSSGDLDGDGFADLVVGSPYACSISSKCGPNEHWKHQRGVISAFLSSTWKFASGQSIDLNSASWNISSPFGWSWLGYQTAVEMVDGKPTLLATSPLGNSSTDLRGPGMIESFKVQPSSFSPSSTLYSTSQKAKLGQSFSLGSPITNQRYLAIAEPSWSIEKFLDLPESYLGRVHIVPAEILKSTVADITKVSKFSISGISAGGRFGWSTTFGDVDGDKLDDLFVSAPFEPLTPGRIFGWTGAKFPNSSVTADSADVCLQYPSMKGKSLFGYNMKTIKFGSSAGPRVLAVGAPRDSTKQPMSGALWLFNFVSS